MHLLVRAIFACAFLLVWKHSVEASNCGVRPSTRIVGGTKAKHGDWPWQAQVRTSSGFTFCGGTLIAPQWVVTASHCLERKKASDIRIRMGAWRRSGRDGQDFRVTQIIMHESYHKPTTYAYDIALLKLDKPAMMNKYVNLACLPETINEPDDGDSCWVTGWGTLSSGGALAQTLMQVSVPVVSQASCKRAYGSYRIHESMICAGRQEGGIDACQGDSGGPMVCESRGRFYLQGVVSWGEGCAASGKYGVYARVKHVMQWIKQNVRGGSGGGGGGSASSCRDKSNKCRRYVRYCPTSYYMKGNCKKTCRLC